jgi:hypothetical protein
MQAHQSLVHRIDHTILPCDDGVKFVFLEPGRDLGLGQTQDALVHSSNAMPV